MSDLYSSPSICLMCKFSKLGPQVPLLGPYYPIADFKNGVWMIDLNFQWQMYLVFPCNLVVTSGYLLVTSCYLTATTG